MFKRVILYFELAQYLMGMNIQIPFILARCGLLSCFVPDPVSDFAANITPNQTYRFPENTRIFEIYFFPQIRSTFF